MQNAMLVMKWLLISTLCGLFSGCIRLPPEPSWAKSRKIIGKEHLMHVEALAVDDQFAFVVVGANLADQQEGKTGVRKISLADGSVTVFEKGDYFPAEGRDTVALDDKYFYWTSTGKILRQLKTGGAIEVIATDSVGMGIDLAMDKERLYWTNHGYYSKNMQTLAPIFSVSKNGGKTEVFSERQYIPNNLIVDDKFLYWVSANKILKKDKRGGEIQAVYEVSEKDNISGLRQDADHLFFVAGTSKNTLYSVSKQGGEAQKLTDNIDSVTQFAVDETYVYYFIAYGFTSADICKVPKTGGAVVKVDSGKYAQGSLVVGKTEIFFSDGFGLFCVAKEN
jgi:hypothetical protein